MTIDNNLLRFDSHLSETLRIFFGDLSKKDIPKWIYRKAEEDHSLAVWDGWQNSINRNLLIAEKCQSEEAKYYLKYGLGRRTLMIFHAFRKLFLDIPPNRTEPLTSDELRTHSNNINLIYMNIRGSLDNIGWAMCHECFGEDLGFIKNKQKIDALYMDKIQKDKFRNYIRKVNHLREWYSNLKEKRDPVAHRIPLSIPPSGLTNEEGKEYDNLIDEALRCAIERDFNSSSEKFAQIEKLGVFVPYFVHRPGEAWPIYPTVPDDLGALLHILDAGWFSIENKVFD